MHKKGTVVLTIHPADILSPHFYSSIGCDTQLARPVRTIASADLLFLPHISTDKKIQHLKEIGIDLVENPCIFSDGAPAEWKMRLLENPSIIFLSPPNNRLDYCRRFFAWFQDLQLNIPVILRFNYSCSKEDLIIHAAAECGSLLIDGFGDGIWLEGPYELSFLRTFSLNILQAARIRTVKTEFISCPSCGRTLFNLQEVTKRIQARTSHLPGVKIAIMGCIVNGPGEMADADFGYVGSKPNKIDLYVGKQCVEKNIDSKEADDRLIALIKESGRWVNP